jgi:hypothetical protein
MVRLGEILLEADVLTKRQLSKALAMQEAGDKRRLGEILVDLGYITVEDLTEIMMQNGSPHEGRLPVVEEPIGSTPVTRIPVAPTAQPIDISENVVMKTKFALDLKTMISAAVGIATLVGFWYALQADIQEAKELPKIGNIYDQEYPSRPEGYNWPRSYEQYKSQVGQLQTDMDDVLDQLDEYEEKIDDLEKEVTNLRIQLANKRDK